jgi:hypothetical protein
MKLIPFVMMLIVSVLSSVYAGESIFIKIKGPEGTWDLTDKQSIEILNEMTKGAKRLRDNELPPLVGGGKANVDFLIYTKGGKMVMGINPHMAFYEVKNEKYKIDDKYIEKVREIMCLDGGGVTITISSFKGGTEVKEITERDLAFNKRMKTISNDTTKNKVVKEDKSLSEVADGKVYMNISYRKQLGIDNDASLEVINYIPEMGMVYINDIRYDVTEDLIKTYKSIYDKYSGIKSK